MDVKRCDRCGAVYEYDFGKNARGTGFLLITDETISDIEKRKYAFMLEGAPTQIMDICPGCAEDFRLWFKREKTRQATRAERRKDYPDEAEAASSLGF